MALHDLKYKLSEDGIKVMEGCATAHLIEEINKGMAEAFREITVTIDHDPDFGICRIVAVNNHNICGCS